MVPPQSMAAPDSSSWRLVDSMGSELHVDDGMVLGRQQLGPGFDFVSRKQAVLNIDGAQLFVTSHGRNPTGLLPAGSTEWHWLRPQDDRVPVTPGSVIVLDKKRRDTARFTLLSTPPTPCRTSLGEDAGSDTRGGTSSGHGGSAVPIELSSDAALDPSHKEYHRRQTDRTKIAAQNRANESKRFSITMAEWTTIYSLLKASTEDTAPVLSRQLKDMCDLSATQGIAGQASKDTIFSTPRSPR